jgi:prevent-host-death family protein
MKKMDASKLRRSLARVLESVRDRQEAVIIVRYGQPIAALIPMEHLSLKDRRSIDSGSRGGGPPRGASGT